MVLSLLLACADPAPPPSPPGPCDRMRAPASGPRSGEIALALDRPIEVAKLRIEEARLTADPGFYTLAKDAADCALDTSQDDTEARRLLVHIALQFHQFAKAEADATSLAEDTHSWQDHMLLGDARMEQGRLDEALVAYQAAMDIRPNLQLYDRVAWIAWLKGDIEGAIDLQKLAVSAGSSSEPEPYAWVLTRMGWLHALHGDPPVELALALKVVPDYAPARFARGRLLLSIGEGERAVADLKQAGPTVEAVRAIAEIDPTQSVDAVGKQDARGYGIWLADQGRAAEAIPLLEEELKARQDAVTQMAHAWAVTQSGGDGKAGARAALATGCIEPRVLLEGGLILDDPALLRRALAMGAGLLPSERTRAEAALKTQEGGGTETPPPPGPRN